MSQSDLVAKIGYSSQQNIGSIERGNTEPGVVLAHDISEALGKPIEYFISK